MSAAANIRKLTAFFHRDFAIARGYRGALVLETFEALFGVATYYYLSRFVQSPELTQALPAGSNYFAFALVGFAFFDYLNVSIDAFDTSLNEAMQNRTLEALLVTQTPLPLILAGSAIYPFVTLALRTCVYLAWAALLFGFAPRSANWPGAAAVLLASVLAFACAGCFGITRRNDVSDFGSAQAFADNCALDPRHIFARRDAGRFARWRRMESDWSVHSGSDCLCRDSPSALFPDLCMGPQSNEGHRDSHAYLEFDASPSFGCSSL